MRIQVSPPVEHKLLPKSRRAICSLVRSLSYSFRTLVFFCFFLNGNNLTLPNTNFPPLGEIQDLIALIEVAMSFPWYPLPPQFNDTPPNRPVPPINRNLWPRAVTGCKDRVAHFRGPCRVRHVPSATSDPYSVMFIVSSQCMYGISYLYPVNMS